MNDAAKVLVVASANSDVLCFVESLKSVFETEWAKTIEMSLFLAREWAPQVIVALDEPALLKHIDTFMLTTSMQGIIFLTHHSSLENERRLFGAGADHVLSLRDHPDRLAMRCKALTTRKMQSPRLDLVSGDDATLQFENLSIHLNSYLVRRNNLQIHLPPTQFELLKILITNQDKLFSRGDLKKTIWTQSDISLRSIDAQLSKLKSILPEVSPYIVNIYGKGYLFSSRKRAA